MFLLSLSAALKGTKTVRTNRGYCSNCVMFLCFIPVMCKYFPWSSFTVSLSQDQRNRTWWKTARKEPKCAERTSERQKRSSTAGGAREETTGSKSLPGKKVADGKCFRRRRTFLVELTQTVISTVETRRRHPIPPSRVTLLDIYIFLVVFFFIILSMFQDSVCTQKARRASAVLVPPNSSSVVVGGGGGGGSIT